MVLRRRSTMIRAGPKFMEFRDTKKRQFEELFEQQITDAELTDSIVEFWEEEQLDKIAMRRAKKRRRGGFFS